MTITVNSLIRAGAMARASFPLREDFEIRIFPSDCPDRVIVTETPKPGKVGGYTSPYALMPEREEVDLIRFETRYNSDGIRMGYSKRLNILCLSLP